MDVEQLKQDAREGRVEVDRLVDLVGTLQRKLAEAQQHIQQLQEENRQLQQKLGSTTAKLDQPYSLKAEQQRQEQRGKKKRKKPKPRRRGRIATAEKLKLAEREESVFPAGVDPQQCQLSHSRPVWRLDGGRAVLVAYHVYRGPGNRYGQIPGVLGRSEFGIEFSVALAYQVYVVGLSFGQVCLLMNFFQGLRLSKSQVDALLHRLARHWEGEFEQLCTLLANSLVVHADETGWSRLLPGEGGRSVWAFLSEKARLLLFGVHKDAETLRQILDPETFAGIVISDDAAVYAHFSQSQKCWAHLLRKAIKLTLEDPDHADYRRLADGLLDIYRAACRIQRDRRLSDAGRARKVIALEDEIVDLCGPVWAAELPPSEGSANDYRRLCNELMRLMLARQLFTFVTAPPVSAPHGGQAPVAGTNNEAERSLRRPALARHTGRTNKSVGGARRQTVLTSVLESLRQYLPALTLSSVIAEIERWTLRGRSCFAELMQQLKLTTSSTSLLDRVLPRPPN